MTEWLGARMPVGPEGDTREDSRGEGCEQLLRPVAPRSDAESHDYMIVITRDGTLVLVFRVRKNIISLEP